MTDEAKQRKETPIYSGFIKYFPDAIAEVARVSFKATAQHHPDKEMHWDRDKSPDQLDCIARHLTDHARGNILDTDGQRHLAKCAWRALAALQIEIERERKLKK